MLEHPSSSDALVSRSHWRLWRIPAASITQPAPSTPPSTPASAAGLKHPAVVALTRVQIAYLIIWNVCKRICVADLERSGSNPDPSEVCPPPPDPVFYLSPVIVSGYFGIPQMADVGGACEA